MSDPGQNTKPAKPTDKGQGKRSRWPKGYTPPGAHPPWKPGQSGNPGGRPKSAEHAKACRAAATKYLARIDSGECAPEVVQAFTALCNFGGFMSVDQVLTGAATLARILSGDLTPEQRQRVLEDWQRMGIDLLDRQDDAPPALPEPAKP